MEKKRMAKSTNAGDGAKRVVEQVASAERAAGVTQRAEEAEAERGRVEGMRLSREAAARVVEAERTSGHKNPVK
jgi:hypothetical protein